MQPRAELLGQRPRRGETPLGAVQEVLEADPGPHSAVGAVGAHGFEQRPVGVDRLEVVVAVLVATYGTSVARMPSRSATAAEPSMNRHMSMTDVVPARRPSA